VSALPTPNRWFAPRVLVLASLAVFWTTSANAQDLSDVLSLLLTNRSVSTGDFTRDEQAAKATSDTVARALLIDLATLPVISAGGGFAYTMNPSLGTVERSSDSFGPLFTERAMTTGRRQLSFGATYRFTRFDRLDGRDLRSGTLVTTANQFVDESKPFDVETLKLDLRATTVTLFANVGATDRLDFGLALPLVSLSVDGERFDTYRGQTFLQAKASANATGLADLAVRAKYHALGSGATGLAAAAELRLPTGSESNLLGAGSAAFKLMVVGSAERGRLAAHANTGFVVGGVFDEFDYNGAVTVAVNNRLTILGELIGRRFDAPSRITELALPHPTLAGVQTIRLVPDGVGLNTAVVVAGLKVNLGSTWLLGAHVMLPATDSGLRARPTPLVALDYSFTD
jgi:hypothetical protein